MKVCHISTVHDPFDGRIFHKECKSLADAGFEVYLVAAHDSDEEVDGIRIRAIKRLHHPVKRILVAPVAALRRAIKTKAAFIHLHDPELLWIGFLLAVFGKKVIFDSHEYVGEQILSKEWIPTKPIRILVSKMYKGLEYLLTLPYYGIIVAVDDCARQFRHKKRLEVVKNFPILKYINDRTSNNISTGGKRVVFYAGGLTRIRGIKEIVMAMKDVDAVLWLMGPWETDAYRKECESLESWSKVKYLGKIPFGEQYDYFRAADIGMATLYPEQNYLRSLPVKVFEYMACGTVPIMSNFEYWQEFFGGHALFVDPFSPEDIAEKINTVLGNDALMNRMKQQGIEKVNADFSWEEEHKKLLAIYNFRS